MKTSKEAIEIAIKIKQEAEDFDFCLKWLVCPVCAKKIQYLIKEEAYKCIASSCNFEYVCGVERRNAIKKYTV